LKKGAKQVAWKGIREANEWFIDETFLLSLRTFDNPTRLTEHNLRAYWKHWYNLSQSGKPFTFKRTGARDPSSHTNNNEPNEENLPKEDMATKQRKGPTKDRVPEEDKVEKMISQADESDDEKVESQAGESDADDEEKADNQSEEGEDEVQEKVVDQPGKSDAEDEDKHSDPGKKPLTPDQCHSEKKKKAFLRSLVHTNGEAYQDVLDVLAQMRVSPGPTIDHQVSSELKDVLAL
jgi:hypothetical protein